MRKIALASAAATALFVATPALATEMHCNVHRDYASAIDGKKFKAQTRTGDLDIRTDNWTTRHYNTKVKDTFKGSPGSVSSKDYNRFVHVKFGTERTTATSVNVQVRPRKSSECLLEIYNQRERIWNGIYCNTKNHQKAGKLTLQPMEPYNGLHWVIGSANTGSKVNHFFGIYARKSGEHILVGACVENK